MRIICVGYGRLGSQVVKLLDTQKHEVAVLDKERTALERHDRDLHAKFFLGNAIDEELLREAGASQADALFALTRDENTNLMVAQVAKIVFQIPRIIAVVYDAAREEVFRAAGIETLPITVAGAEYLVSQLDQTGKKRATFKEAWDRAHEGHAAEMPMPAPVAGPRPADQPFYVVVMGGGRVGYFLTRALRQNNIEVTVLEHDPGIYGLITRQVDCPVIFGDGSSIRVQEEAGMGRANVFVAVTNHDQDNLIACQIAKQRFGVAKTIARVKNPRNEVAMQKLGVDITVSSTAIITALIQSELPTSRIRTVLDLRTGGGLELMEYHLDSRSPVAGKPLRQLELPPDCNIVTIIRQGDAIIARGETVLQNGDVVLALVKMAAEPAVRKFLLGG
ncbi:MAG: NAD-binding protein [Acidobacteria bacterium]|nr:NAD-binding protein [Acidobacteriota bacterium]